jgi:hypothetical protein
LLVEARGKIEEYLVKLRLKIHPIKSQLFATKYRSSFLGFRILPGRVRVRIITFIGVGEDSDDCNKIMPSVQLNGKM